MSLENQIELLCAAMKENNSLLREVLAAGGVTPTNVVAITEAPKPAKKQKTEKPPVVEPEPAAVVETEPEPEIVAEETPATTLDPEALIAEITDLWKTKLTNADPGRKMTLKEKFPELRAKWGLAADAKLITLSPTPEKLAGLLADIKTL